MKYLILILFFLTLTSCALFSPNPNRASMFSSAPLELKPFTTDYCSDYPNGTKSDPKKWGDCCFSHDLSYWIGGTERERQVADEQLKMCVDKTQESYEAFIMYTGVRMGGRPGGASFSWGYGWTIGREYQEIPLSDLQKAKRLLSESEYFKQEATRTLVQKFIENILNKRIKTIRQ